MRVLSVHNYYQRPGGEDEVFEAEASLLREHGHEVAEFTRTNAEISNGGRLKAAAGAVWSRQSYRNLRRVMHSRRFSVSHFHNIFPLISPAAYRAAHDERTPVVQTLHNYRVLCPGASLFRGGRVCEACVGKRLPWPGVWRGCYRGSRLASACVAAMISLNRALGTWQNDVDCYVALSEFARRKFIEGGLPAERIAVKSNFVHPDPGIGDGSSSYILFAGRLSPEKGVRTLIQASRLLGKRLPVRIAGDGPERAELERLAQGLDHVKFLGWQPKARVLELMKDAAGLVVSSEWFEGPMVALQAFAVGLPMVASRLGVMEEMIDDSRTGLLFRAGDPVDLAAKMELLLADRRGIAAIRRESRAEFEAKYTAEENYRELERIYQFAIDRSRGSRSKLTPGD